MSNTNKNDLYPREVDELLKKKEFKQAILLLKKSNSLNPGNRKIIKKLYSSIINYEIYKNNNIPSLNHKKTLIYKIIFIFKIINKRQKLKIIEKLWMKDPLNYFLVNEYLNTLCENKKQKRGVLLLESITERINNEIWLYKYLGGLYNQYKNIEKEFYT